MFRRPDTNVVGVIDEISEPGTLEVGVGDFGSFPRSTSSGVLALGVSDRGSDPISIILVRPFFRLLLHPIQSDLVSRFAREKWVTNDGGRVRDSSLLILVPVDGNDSLLIHDHLRSGLVPVGGFDLIRISDFGRIDPVFRLDIGNVVDHLVRVDGGGKVG